jgi:hypothetical protein
MCADLGVEEILLAITMNATLGGIQKCSKNTLRRYCISVKECYVTTLCRL